MLLNEVSEGEAVHPIEDMYEVISEARFPYEETEDQMAAIESVIDDMGSGQANGSIGMW